MPGRLFLTTPIARIAADLGAEPGECADEPPRRNIAPGQEIVTCPPGGRLRRMRWGVIPVGRLNARGRPVMETVINARSETVFEKAAFAGMGRCLVPADGWYEWTGTRRRKTAWRITRADGAGAVFAAIFDSWRAPNGAVLLQVATLTCAPNAELAPIHHRMGVVLSPADFQTWLTGSAAEASTLLAPLPDDSLRIEEVGDVDWSGP